MSGWDGWRVGLRARAALVVLAWAAGAAASQSADLLFNARLKHPVERAFVAQAIQGAAARLAHAECRGLLDEFADASGRPLRVVLDGLGKDPVEYVQSGVFFYDAPAEVCRQKTLAGAVAPGERAIRVCGSRFAAAMTQNRNHAEAVIIHEMLHSLGLGENPPTSAYITDRVLGRCRRY